MKLGNYDAHQSKMFFCLDEVMGDVLGDFKYYMAVYDSHTPQYKQAKAFLSQGHDKLAAYLYNEVMSCCHGSSFYSDALFAGGDFLKKIIEKRLKQWDL